MAKEKIVELKSKSRKAIFVNEKVHTRFKELAEKDGRKYSEFLESLLEKK